jgi:hypothetical protein
MQLNKPTMNPKNLMLLIALFCSNAIYAQSESYAPFTITVTGKARNVLSTTSKKDKARLSNGDEVSIIPSQSSWNINIKHEKIGKTISI